MLWFDVGNGRYTTRVFFPSKWFTLWFDVGNGRYTTVPTLTARVWRLWFDVGNGRYTTQRSILYRVPIVVVWCRKRTIYNAQAENNVLKGVVVWCRKRTIYNRELFATVQLVVVVWCRKRTIYNWSPLYQALPQLWFDVGNGRYTTLYRAQLDLVSCGLM